MVWEKFKEFFHESWHVKMQPFIESEACDNIYKHLKSESRRGKTIAPLSHNVYRCFKETSLDDLKVVIVGMAPYHTLLHGQIIADGLLMGCSSTKILQPSLKQYYGAIEKEFADGLSLTAFQDPDVRFLAEQGVLMLNASLTTEISKAGSHMELWEPFIKYVFEEILAVTGVPVIFLGKEAAKFEKYMPPFSWHFEISHPASASYRNVQWDSEGVFKKVNKILKDVNGFEINWVNKLPF